jgi:hypothetical protein
MPEARKDGSVAGNRMGYAEDADPSAAFSLLSGMRVVTFGLGQWW